MAFILKYNTPGLIKMKSVERVVSPIATHLYYLILICESGESSESFTGLEGAAKEVVDATETMAAVASRFLEGLDDDTMRSEMEPAMSALLASGKHVLLAAQKLSIQPSQAEHKEEFVMSTQNVFLGVVKVLLVADDAVMRKVAAAANSLLSCLSHLEAATNIPALLKAFQGFSDALLLLNTLAMKRADDLWDTRQRHHAIGSLETLKKCVPMLHTALHTNIKHPNSEEAQAAKAYILDQFASTITNLMSTLESNCHGNSSVPNEAYTAKLQELFRILDISPFTLFRDRNCDSLLCDLVALYMEVAKGSRNKLKHVVVNLCQDVLRIWLEISQTVQLFETNFRNKEKMQNIMDDNYKTLKGQLQRLDHTMMTAVVYQVLDVFVAEKFPFNMWVNALNRPLNCHSSRMDTLKPLITAFDCHADRMFLISGFVSGLSVDMKVVENVVNSTDCVKRLKGTIITFLEKVEETSDHAEFVDALQDLHHRWVEETHLLFDVLSDVFDVKELTSIIIQEMESRHYDCQKAFAVKCHSQFKEQAANLVGYMNLVIQSMKRHINKNDNPIYRNGLLVLVKRGELSISEVTTSIEHILEYGLDVESFEIFSEKTIIAGKQFQHLSQGLNGLQHPHLLSPLREEVRQPPVLSGFPTPDFNNPCLKVLMPITTGVENKNPPFQPFRKDSDEMSMVFDIDNDSQSPATSDMNPVQVVQDIHLMPPLQEILNAAKKKDLTAVNMANTDVLELSNCYAKAAQIAGVLIDTGDRLKLENLREEIVATTHKVVRLAQEAAMGSSVSADSIAREAIVFSDRIYSMRQILLPATGTWYHAICLIFQGQPNKTVADKTQEVNEVMRACADVVELVTSSDLSVHGKHQECVAVHKKLKTTQANAKHLTDLATLMPEPYKLETLGILWALSIQALLNAIDKMLGSAEEGGKGHLTLQKRLAMWSENSLRIQEASELSSLNCKNKNTIKNMRGLQQEVKSLTEAYLQAADNLGSVSCTDIHQLARTECLQRQLQVKMNALLSLVSTTNKEYTDAVKSIVHLAHLAAADKGKGEKTQTAHVDFERCAESLLENVKAAAQKIQDSLLYIRDPRVRSSLRFTKDHLSSQTSEIVSRARKMAETQDPSEVLSLEVQKQCWSAKARFLVEEINKVEGIHQATKDQMKQLLQGKQLWEMPVTLSEVQTEETRPVKCPRQISSALSVNMEEENNLAASEVLPKMGDRQVGWTEQPHCSSDKRHGGKDISHGPVPEEKRSHPGQSKEAFIYTAREMISGCQSITQFVRVIAEHCLDKRCKDDLLYITEQILTITNQLTIISSVNAATASCKSSNEILVKNAQSLLHVILRGIRAAETACIKGLKQPDPDSDGAEAAVLCLQWRRNLLTHRAQQNSCLETDELGLRKTSQYLPGPSLAAHPLHEGSL
ncbi:uncharacterized protein LOC125739076 isoform X2 [Brienomyrus brachyistius]|uniref:uncharacterized protein LOC125739076 isoform X2 n=1 Tax=Brienomyrus brachyistius TaxID=42636 RepID=UPI0020B2B9C4|nr:uncharacterized protein LOC125739076 isoform X2 [Brienomyrus brachyistius]